MNTKPLYEEIKKDFDENACKLIITITGTKRGCESQLTLSSPFPLNTRLAATTEDFLFRKEK